MGKVIQIDISSLFNISDTVSAFFLNSLLVDFLLIIFSPVWSFINQEHELEDEDVVQIIKKV